MNYILLVRNVNIVMVGVLQRKHRHLPHRPVLPMLLYPKLKHASQPAAENLPVCLELLGTQAGPGEEERHRRAGEQVGTNNTGKENDRQRAS